MLLSGALAALVGVAFAGCGDLNQLVVKAKQFAIGTDGAAAPGSGWDNCAKTAAQGDTLGGITHVMVKKSNGAKDGQYFPEVGNVYYAETGGDVAGEAVQDFGRIGEFLMANSGLMDNASNVYIDINQYRTSNLFLGPQVM
jgi:hypothetical protein